MLCYCSFGRWDVLDHFVIPGKQNPSCLVNLLTTKNSSGLNSSSLISFGVAIEDSLEIMHCVKSVQIWSFVWSVFSHIRAEYGAIRSISVSLRIQPECGKIRTRQNSVFGHFSRNNGVISSFNVNVSKKNFSCLFLIVMTLCRSY